MIRIAGYKFILPDMKNGVQEGLFTFVYVNENSSRFGLLRNLCSDDKTIRNENEKEMNLSDVRGHLSS